MIRRGLLASPVPHITDESRAPHGSRGFAVRPVLCPPELGAGATDDPPREELPVADGESSRERRGTLPRALPSFPDCLPRT